MNCAIRTGLVLLAAWLLAATAACAQTPWQDEAKQNWKFPKAMKVVDVKAGFGAKGDGVTDDTEALQNAFNQRSAFVYLPNGTYLVRDRLQYKFGPSIGPTIFGESRDGVVIRLADKTKGFDDPDKPRAVVRLIKDGKVSADYFKIRLTNLTVDVGDNPGATGVMFYSNNNGQCRNVRITGNGAMGLDLSYMLNGPLLVSNVEIDGFDIGIHAGSGPFNSQTLEHIVLKDQRSTGLRNLGEALFVRDLHSSGPGTGVINGGAMVLVDSELQGGRSGEPAIRNAGRMFARNVLAQGYGSAIQPHESQRGGKVGPATGSPVPGGGITEWTHEPAVGLATKQPVRSLNLPAEVPPFQAPPVDPEQWVCVDDFGANGTDEEDDTAAVQRAFDHAREHNRKVVCFAADGRYIVNGRVDITASIERIQGAGSYVLPSPGKSLRFVVGNGASKVVTFHLLDRPLGKHDVTLENASGRTLVNHHLRCKFVGSGAGRTFLEDSSAFVSITNPRHRVWARQLNSESGEQTNHINDGGTLWVLGLKTERNQTLIETRKGGRTEVLGAWVYQTLRGAPTRPMFVVTEASASFATIVQYNWRGDVYPDLVEYSRGSRKQTFTRKDNNDRASFDLVRVGN